MARRSMTLSGRQGKAQPCKPAPCEEICCNLDCLVQPRFFCGQLLTDQDLTALLRWSQDKLRLSRYRDGWGVVCGLEVRCDTAQAGSVIVGPGYALSCCGDDIILCEEACIDLSPACAEEGDPCADLVGRGASRAEESDGKEEFRAVDLYIHYRETPSDPQAAFGRNACGEAAECEYSRTQETYTLRWQPAVRGSDPVKAAAIKWHRGYASCLEVLDAFQDAVGFPTGDGQGPRGSDIQRWLLRWIQEHPLHQFCFIRDRICEMSEEALTQEAQIAELLFWIVQDCRNHFLACACHSCLAEEGVPLARVYLRPRQGDGKGRCDILAVDPYPPYRRPLSPACWPAPLGQVNGGQLIWHRWEEACTALADLGVRVAGREDFSVPETVDGLREALKCMLFLSCEERTVVQVYQQEDLGARVIGFCGGAEPQQPLGLEVNKRGRPTRVRPGGVVNYVYEVTNTGRAPLVIDVQDDPVGGIASDVDLDPGETKTFESTFAVPDNASGVIRNTVKVNGAAADGRTTVATDEHVTRIVQPSNAEVSLEKRSDPAESAERGEPVTYIFEVTNTGDVPLSIEVRDSLLGQVAGGNELAQLEPGETRAFQAEMDVPSTASGELENEAKVVGTTSDGQEVAAVATHSLRIVRVVEEVVINPREIEDLGERRAERLRNAGVNTYGALAEMPRERLLEVFADDTAVTEEMVLRWQERALELLEGEG